MDFKNHKIAYCGTCRQNMIICGTCGNNCCNGGSGQIDGKLCPDCDEAYDIQTEYWASPEYKEEARIKRFGE